MINCCEIFLGNFQPITLIITTENISQCLSWRRNHANLVKFDCNICYQQNDRFFWTYWTHQYKFFNSFIKRDISKKWVHIYWCYKTIQTLISYNTGKFRWIVKCVFIQSKTFKSRNDALIRTAGILIAELYKSCINSWKYRSQFRKVVNQWFMEFGQTIHNTRIWNSWIKLFLQLITDRPFTF